MLLLYHFYDSMRDGSGASTAETIKYLCLQILHSITTGIWVGLPPGTIIMIFPPCWKRDLPQTGHENIDIFSGSSGSFSKMILVTLISVDCPRMVAFMGTVYIIPFCSWGAWSMPNLTLFRKICPALFVLFRQYPSRTGLRERRRLLMLYVLSVSYRPLYYTTIALSLQHHLRAL